MEVTLHGPLVDRLKLRVPRPSLLYSWQQGDWDRSERSFTRVRVSCWPKMLDLSKPVRGEIN